MNRRLKYCIGATRGIVFLGIWLFAIGVQAQNSGPFAALAGSWSGSGTINISNGVRERIRCRATYDVLSEGRNLQLNLRCASESYNFDLRSSVTSKSGAVTGTWSEATRNAAGTLSGRVNADRIQVLTDGPTFSADLTLIIRGDQQSVVIKTKGEKAAITGASITLRRG